MSPGDVSLVPHPLSSGSSSSRRGEWPVRVLVVDDEAPQRRIVAEILDAAGFDTAAAGGLDEALRRLGDSPADVVVTDLRMPGGSGIDLLARVKELDGDVEVILMTAYSDVRTAVEAMQRGALDYLAKPFEKEELVVAVEKAAERCRLRRENRNLRALAGERFGYGRMLGRSAAMQEVYRTIDKVHSAGSTVLLRGESGTGKELVARAIHWAGTRRERPFVAINCAAIPELLIESELFGHERGAFTGALASKAGRFEEVADGTLFLDEIGSMRVDLQAKLLRVIQEREFQRIGGTRMMAFRGRIVAATSQDLESLLREGKFREDLFFRLNVVPIDLPPLRERREDVPLLAQHFLERCAERLDKGLRSFTHEALAALEAYPWPGNVRELENAIERAVVLAEEDVEAVGLSMLPPAIASREREPPRTAATNGGRADISLPDAGLRLSEVERELIRQALQKAGGRLEPAARLLGITYKTLQYRIRKHSLQDYQRSS